MGYWKDSHKNEKRSLHHDIKNELLQMLSDFLFNNSPLLKECEELHERMEKLSFVQPCHLDLNEKFFQPDIWACAQRELCSMAEYASPSVKLQCILNCCRVISFLLNSVGVLGGADDFFPLLIAITLRANPPYVLYHLNYISTFSLPRELKGEGLYYFMQFQSGISFIEKMDASVLNIGAREFERKFSGEEYQPSPSPDTKRKRSASFEFPTTPSPKPRTRSRSVRQLTQ